MTSLKTLEELIETFDEASMEEKPKVLKRIDIPVSEMEEHATWESESYTRNCVYRCDDFEIILLCWDAGAETKIHDHGGQDCWIYQVKGDLKEQRFIQREGEALKKDQVVQIEENSLSYMNDSMGYHSIKNDSNERALTLHFYASPIDECNTYCIEKRCFEPTELEYSSIADIEVS